ncbi:MAG TPA: hypothetical protein VMT31_06875 [Methanomicrobiales archaeon]|nr:hypothetical protein [Methanomicrobiales archaeon]
MKDWKDLFKKIKDGATISDSDITEILIQADYEDRKTINHELATILFESNDPRLNDRGYTCAERAWIQSGFDKKIFQTYLKYLGKRQEIEKIRACYKQLGINALYQKDYNNAMKYFNLWQRGYLNYFSIDKYEYDFPLLDLIEKQLSGFQFDSPSGTTLKKDEKIRIVYLVHGIIDSSSILTKILLNIIQYHDTSRFEIHVFTTESWIRLFGSSGRVFINQFKATKCQIHYAPPFRFGFSQLMSIAKQMHALRPHILVTLAALAHFEHFFIGALKPAPVRVGFVFGPPAQFIPPSFDFGISWNNHIILDCPVPCINSGITYLPEEKTSKKLSKMDFGLLNDATVMISTGRYPKFQDESLLTIIIEAMTELPNLHYIIVGPLPHQIPFLDDIPSEDVKKRIHIFGWSSRYEDYLSIADIYLDTYPSGGGVTLFDAAIQHLPIISFTDDYSKTFDQCNWNPAQELFPDNSIILIDRNDLSGLKSIICKLYQNSDLRKDLGNKAYNSITDMRAQIGEHVKKIESLYTDLVKQSNN